MALNNYKVLGQVSSGSVSFVPVTNNALTTNVVTLTSGINHGLKAGDRAYIVGNTNTAINGSYLVASAPSNTTFTYPKTASNITSAATTSTSMVTLSAPIGLAVTNKAKANGIVTLTVSNTAGISAGDYIDVYINDAAFDGSYLTVLDVPNSTTLRYILVGADVTSAAVSSGALSAYAAQTIYTVPSAKEAILATVLVNSVNRIGLSARFSLYAVLSGESGTPQKSIIIPWTDLQDGEVISYTLGLSLSAGDKLVARALTPGISITATGTELT
jgi:ethanolamine utilization microcompartment shell protein EutS